MTCDEHEGRLPLLTEFRRAKNENGQDVHVKKEEEGKGRIHKRLRQVKCLTHTSTRIRISVFEVVLDCKKTFLENAENLDQNIKKCRNGLGNKRRGKGFHGNKRRGKGFHAFR